MKRKVSNFEEKLIKSEEVFKGKLLKLTLNEVELPDKNITEREVVSHPGAVAIVPITSKDEVVMVRQYRFAIKRHTLELPAGTLKKAEKPIGCAKRELEEEIKMRARKWEKLVTIHPSPGYCNEKIHIFLAKELENLSKKGDKGKDIGGVQENIKSFRKSKIKVKKFEKDEFINKIIISLKSAKDKILTGEITDAKTIVGIMIVSE